MAKATAQSTPTVTGAPASRPSSYPTITELPPAAEGVSRNTEDMMRLMLIPPDDVAFRAAAIELFRHDEAGANRVGGPSAAERDAHFRISGHPARTPGGAAWKVATALSCARSGQDENEWPWWQHLLNDAVADLIDIERQRQAGAPVADTGGAK